MLYILYFQCDCQCSKKSTLYTDDSTSPASHYDMTLVPSSSQFTRQVY